MNQFIYDIEGLDCARCAQSLEDYLNRCEEIENAKLNFISKTLTIRYAKKSLNENQLLKLCLKATDDLIQIQLHQDNKSLKTKIFDKEILINVIRIVISSILLIVGVLVFGRKVEEGITLPSDQNWIGLFCLSMTSYLIISYDYLWKFIKSFRHPSKMFNETVLMVVASIGALAIQQFPEAVLVMILAQVGEIFEHISVNKSKNSIIDTIDTRPKMASVIKNEKIQDILASKLEVGDIIVIKTGEIIPCDGKVVKGEGLLDTSSVTGEFKPVALKENDEVLSGTNLVDGSIRLKVEKKFSDSTTSKILDMVMESSEYKSKAETFIGKFANWYTPIMFALAIIIGVFVPLIHGGIIKDYSWLMAQKHL